MQIRSLESSFVWLHRLTDLVLPPVALYITSIVYGVLWTTKYESAAILSGLLLLIINQYSGIYHSWRGRSLFEGIRIVFKSWLMVWALLILLAFAMKISDHYSRAVLIGWFLLTPILLTGYRSIIRAVLARLYSSGYFVKHAAIYGYGDTCSQLEYILNNNPWLGYKITGIFDNTNIRNDKISGGLEDVLEACKGNLIQTLYITLPANREDEIKNILNELADTTVTVKYVPDFFSFDLLHASMNNMGGLPVVNIYDSPLNDPGKAFIKRAEDLILSILILLLISPALLILGILVKLSSPGPIIFKQTRYGLNGEKIIVYKFRTMFFQKNENNVKQAVKNDPRVTRVGKILRKYSLDELPQFLNVVQGKMSIVGPRPHAVSHNEEYRSIVPKYMQRHLVKPGITGWAQINGWRGETDTIDKMVKRVEFDLHYINNWSVWFDLRIIFLTIFKGIINKNAY